MSQVEATSNSEKIKPIALSIVEWCLAEGISKLVNIFTSLIKQVYEKLRILN